MISSIVEFTTKDPEVQSEFNQIRKKPQLMLGKFSEVTDIADDYLEEASRLTAMCLKGEFLRPATRFVQNHEPLKKLQ